jgi:hypothetical protein
MRCLVALLLSGLAASCPSLARAADPSIAAAETSVRLGVTAGYGNFEDNAVPRDNQAGGLFGVTAGVSALTTSVLPSTIWPDLYTEVGYDFSAAPLDHSYNGQSSQGADAAYYNTAIVRLGAGTPIGGGQELIPYIAGGYQTWSRHESGPMGGRDYDQAELAGGGLRLDVTASPALVLSIAAEGFAVIGSGSAPSEDFDARFGTTTEERVSLDADYRLSRTWHVFAGVGVTHYDDAASQLGGARALSPFSSTLQVNSMFGLAYGF